MIFKKKNHPIESHSYAVVTGAYVGEMLIFMEEKGDNYKFISIPKNQNRDVPKDKFHFGFTEGIVEFVDKIPNEIFQLLKKQYLFNLKKTK